MIHEWVDASGMPWTPTSTDDMCAICSRTPDAHEKPVDLIDRQRLLVGLRKLTTVESSPGFQWGVNAAIAFVEDAG